MPKGFFPTEDTGYMIGITEGNTDIAFPAMVEHQRKVADIVRADKDVAYVNSTVGSGGPNTLGNSGRMLVALKPRNERDSLQKIIARLRQSANVVPGMQIFFQPIQNINLGGGSTRASISTHCSPTTPTTSIASRRSCATRSRKFRGCSMSRPTST